MGGAGELGIFSIDDVAGCALEESSCGLLVLEELGTPVAVVVVVLPTVSLRAVASATSLDANCCFNLEGPSCSRLRTSLSVNEGDTETVEALCRWYDGRASLCCSYLVLSEVRFCDGP